MKDVILITGANGFLGSKCCEAFENFGYEVRRLVRNPANTPHGFRCELPDQIDENAFKGDVRAVIHCAYETQFQNIEQARRTNIEGTRKVFELARKHGVKQFVFISSLAAHDEARSFYGKSKRELERLIESWSGSTIIKPGTIVGPGAVFGRTRELVRKMPVLPLFYGGSKRLQTVWIDDVCKAIVNSVQNALYGTFVVAEETGTPMRDFYRGLAVLEGKRPVVLPFPGDFSLALVRLVERLGIKLPVSSENLLGIKHLRGFAANSDAKALGLRMRPFDESLLELARMENRPEAESELKFLFSRTPSLDNKTRP